MVVIFLITSVYHILMCKSGKERMNIYDLGRHTCN